MVQVRTLASVQINGPALRAIRERSGVSCTALARAVLADVSFLARVERGEKRGVRRETFERLCFELEITDPRAILASPYGDVPALTPDGMALSLNVGTPLGTVTSSSTRTATA